MDWKFLVALTIAAVGFIAVLVWLGPISHIRRNQQLLKGRWERLNGPDQLRFRVQACPADGCDYKNATLGVVYELAVTYGKYYGQQFVILQKHRQSESFEVGVLHPGYWDGHGQPPVKFSGWTYRIAPDDLLDPKDLSPRRLPARRRADLPRDLAAVKAQRATPYN